MEIRTLKYFMMVANEGNFTRAAERLYLTQPTLSRQLKELEEEYGAKLFLREPRHVYLTEEGQLLKRRAEEILALVDETEQELRQQNNEISGDIHMGAGESIYFGPVLGLVSELRSSHPGIHMQVITGDGESCLYLLERGIIDFAFMYGDPDPERFDMLALPYKDQWGLLLRQDDELALKAAIRPEDLWNRPLLLSRQVVSKSTHGDDIRNWLQKPLEELNIAGTYSMAYNGSLMVREGIGIMVTFRDLINTAGTDLCMLPLIPAVYAEPRIIWRKNQTFAKPSQLFLETLQERFGTKRTGSGADQLCGRDHTA